MQYQINIAIDDAGLQKIYAAAQSVTLVKSIVANPVVSGNLPVVWLAFQPLEENQITWIENYNLYATTTVLLSGTTIMMTSQTQAPVQPGWLYTFEQGQFSGASGTGSTFNLANQMASGSFNFGLAQQATVNNVSTLAPLNAQPVLYNEQASFTPIETISIFLSSYSNNGVVISQVASNALTVQLTSQSPIASVGFNDATNTFYLQTVAARVTGQVQAQAGQAALANTEILNEAGSAVLSTGYALNWLTPVTVSNLSNAAAILLHHDYQVGPTGGRYTGLTCTQVGGGVATFNT